MVRKSLEKLNLARKPPQGEENTYKGETDITITPNGSFISPNSHESVSQVLEEIGSPCEAMTKNQTRYR